MDFTYTTKLSLIGIVGVIISIIVFCIWRKNRGKCKLERDACGLWRYNKDSQFTRKVAYKCLLEQAGAKAEKLKPLAVLTFVGDIGAKQYKSFGQLIDEVIINKSEIDEVVVVVNSPGGAVSPYGNVYSQMERVRDAGLKLTVCIDVVAASGGYLMSLPAHKIIAAPFSMVGSVGVMAFVPNLRGLLEDYNINPRTFTAGKYKRTVSLTDEATEEEVEKFKQQLNAIHRLFLEAVKKYRKDVKMEVVETGEHWTARESVELGLGLVDDIATSQQYLLEANRDRDLIILSQKRGFWEGGLLSRFVQGVIEKIELRLFGQSFNGIC